MLRRLLYPSLIGMTLFGGCRCFDQCDIPSSSLARFDVQRDEGHSPSYDLTQPKFCDGVRGLRLALERVSGDAQSAPIGALVPGPPTVRLLTSATRTAVHDIVVTWAVTSGGGVLTGAADVPTNQDGHSSAPQWRLGTTAGPNTITATVDALALGATVSGSPLTFTVTATPPATLLKVSGDNQSAVAGQALSQNLSVQIVDANGIGVPDFTVSYAVTAGGGSVTVAPDGTGGGVSAVQRLTNAQGIAVLGPWTIGTVAGNNALTATAPGLTGSPALFSATGISGPAHTLSVSAGNAQTALRSTAVQVPPAVRLVDANGNPVAGAEVTFTPILGGGTVQGSPATTAANGVATVGGWTLGPNPGENRLRAVVTGFGIIGNPAEFIATATAPVAASVVAFAGNGQTGTAGFAVPTRPAVRVTDSNGAPVAGEPVLFLILATPGFVAGSVNGASQTTDANGEATVGGWILANQAGPNQLRATVLSPNVAGDPVTFNATGVAGTPVIMAKVAGDNQSAPPGFSPEVLPTVRVADFHNNPVAGVTITFAVTGGGGTVSGGIVVTDAQGRARVGGWLMGPVPGPNTLSATANATTITGNPATFTATGFIASVRAPPR